MTFNDRAGFCKAAMHSGRVSRSTNVIIQMWHVIRNSYALCAAPFLLVPYLALRLQIAVSFMTAGLYHHIQIMCFVFYFACLWPRVNIAALTSAKNMVFCPTLLTTLSSLALSRSVSWKETWHFWHVNRDSFLTYSIYTAKLTCTDNKKGCLVDRYEGNMDW